MNSPISYPKMRRRPLRLYEVQLAARWLLVAFFVFAAIWNLVSHMNGATKNYFSAVSLFYVWVIYSLIFPQEIIETGFIQWFSRLCGMGICGILLSLIVGEQPVGTVDAVMQSMAVTLLLCSIVYFLNFKQQRHNIAPLFLLLTCAVVLGVLLVCGAVDNTVSARAFLSYAALFAAVAFIGFRKDVCAELRKKLHS